MEPGGLWAFAQWIAWKGPPRGASELSVEGWARGNFSWVRGLLTERTAEVMNDRMMKGGCQCTSSWVGLPSLVLGVLFYLQCLNKETACFLHGEFGQLIISSGPVASWCLLFTQFKSLPNAKNNKLKLTPPHRYKHTTELSPPCFSSLR